MRAIRRPYWRAVDLGDGVPQAVSEEDDVRQQHTVATPVGRDQVERTVADSCICITADRVVVEGLKTNCRAVGLGAVWLAKERIVTQRRVATRISTARRRIDCASQRRKHEANDGENSRKNATSSKPAKQTDDAGRWLC